MVRCDAMSMTDEEFRHSAAQACSSAGTTAAEAIVVLRCSAMAWTDEEHTGKVLVMHADPVASTAVVTVVQLAPDSTAAENRYMERE